MPDKHDLFPIFCGEYEIDDERFVSHQEVVIRSRNGPVPSPGDQLTIVRDEGLHDLVVLTVRGDPDWTAHCHVRSA